MSEVGGYVLHLYCDNPQCEPGDGFDEFSGRNYSRARSEATRAGWRFPRNIPEGWTLKHSGRVAECPACQARRTDG